MRLFTIKIIDEKGGARIECNFEAGGQETSTKTENRLADILKMKIGETFSGCGFITGTGHGDTMEEADQMAKIEADIRTAGE